MVIRIASFVPPMAPLTMPARIILGDAPLSEVADSIALMLLSIYGLMRLGGRLYSGSILSFGTRTKLREAWQRSSPSAPPSTL